MKKGKKMNKIFLLLLSSLLFMGCSKEKTELELVQESNNQEVVETKEILAEETRPLLEITKDDELQIWVRADGAPGMFLNSNNEVEGFYVDLDRAVMEEMGQKFNFVPYTDLGPLLQKLKDGSAHSALATPDLPDFRSFLNVSTTYELLNFVIFLPQSSSEIIPDNKEDAIKSLYGKKVGVQTRGHIYQVLRDHKEIEIIEYATTTVAMEAMHNGEVDAVPEVKRIGVLYAKENNWDVKPVGAPIFGLDIGTGFSKVLDTSVVDRYNKAMQTLIDNGFVANLYEEYFGQ